MTEVLTVPESTTQWPEPPRLLVEWSSPWEEFKTAFRPALTRAPKALAGEAPVGIFPYRGIVVAWVLECLLLIAVIVLPDRLASFQPVPLPQHPKWDVIYYSGDELPQTADRGGAQSGKSGHAGGDQAHHRTQTIRVARGDKPSEQIVGAPNVKLPHSDSAVANLLALKPNPGPPPAEGLRSSLVAPAMPAQSPVPPSPELQSSSGRTNPALPTNVIQPAPEVSHSNTRSAPALNSAPIAPAPDVAREKMRSANPLATNVVAPAPNVSRDKMRAVNPLANNVVAPAPQDAQRDLASSRAPVSQTTNAVAPPVSAPARDSATAAKLSLPAPAVIAPPPSQVSRDLNSWGSTRSGDIRSQPVPPPPSATGGSLTRSGGGTLTAQVVPPPANMDGLSGASGSGSASGSLSNGRADASQLGPATVVPPPPGIGGGKALGGNGRGNKGLGTGSPLDLGTTAAPPTNAGGNAAGTGVVMSSQPGTKVGLPNSTGGGAIAMSPTGAAKAGLGGSGGGNGIGRGNGPGSGLQGEGSGAGKDGAGKGSDPNARGGISPYPGQGGAGSGTQGTPAIPGTSIQGGATQITLPSFGDGKGSVLTNGPGRSSTDPHKGFNAAVEATARSGGVFGTGYYGMLKGQNYSIYIPTSMGTAVMQYADPTSATHPSKEALTSPEPMRKELPVGLRPTRVIIACILDRSGLVKNVKVLEPGAEETTSKILVALRNWKFRPAFRGGEPVEVNAILGFGIDTR